MKPKAKDEIRSFIAIDISHDIRKALNKFVSKLKHTGEDVRWVRIEGIHLTLKFVGNIKPHMVNEILRAMENSVNGIGPFKVEVKGTGVFPNLKKPRVFWVGVNEETGKLERLAANIEKELKNLGFKEEERKFKPHLTLGRVSQGVKAGKLCDIINDEADRNFGAFEVREIILFKSKLTPTGAEYAKLGAVSLK